MLAVPYIAPFILPPMIAFYSFKAGMLLGDFLVVTFGG